ncbi:MAG TPA: single-stranded DNA-binding protein [Ignavibacteriaceae bacterium]|nr:single-stranded DNA-binding protein [Ignavibacteriaceae bacterium]
MAFSLNKAMLIGNLGKDSETRVTPSNLSVTTFSVATTHGFKNKEGSWTNETTWHNVVAWSLSDYYKEALRKGAKVYIEGRISKRDYTDKDGIKRYTSEIIADKIIPLDGRGDFQSSGSSEPSGGDESANISVEENDDLPF